MHCQCDITDLLSYPSRDGLEAGTKAQLANPQPASSDIPYGTALYSGCSTSDLAHCFWPVKADENGPKTWEPAYTRDIGKKFLTLDSRLQNNSASAVVVSWGN